MCYIPVTKLKGLPSKEGRRCAQANLFHSCMRTMLGSITTYGETGVGMVSGDGILCQCHPVLATYVGDYPEQLLVTGTFSGQCPKCVVLSDQLGNFLKFRPRNYHQTLDLYHLASGDVHIRKTYILLYRALSCFFLLFLAFSCFSVKAREKYNKSNPPCFSECLGIWLKK